MWLGTVTQQKTQRTLMNYPTPPPCSTPPAPCPLLHANLAQPTATGNLGKLSLLGDVKLRRANALEAAIVSC
jgi:hypothetical protein